MSILSDIKDTIKDISDTIFGDKNSAPQLAPVPVQKMEGETPHASSLFGINAGNMVRTGAFALLGLFGASSMSSCVSQSKAPCDITTTLRKKAERKGWSQQELNERLREAREEASGRKKGFKYKPSTVKPRR
jgi:hypothetical protein